MYWNLYLFHEACKCLCSAEEGRRFDNHYADNTRAAVVRWSLSLSSPSYLPDMSRKLSLLKCPSRVCWLISKTWCYDTTDTRAEWPDTRLCPPHYQLVTLSSNTTQGRRYYIYYIIIYYILLYIIKY